MSIADWPKTERPRERLLQLGAEALSDAELLAILLRNGKKGTTVVDIARSLLKRFNGLRGIFQCNLESFCQQAGLGPAKYCELQAVLELGRRHLRENLEIKEGMHCSQDVEQYIISHLRHQTQEVFAVLFLDNQNRIIRFENLFYGTINNATIYPREVVKKSLEYHAAALIVAHNHPSGAPEPSKADQQITSLLKRALKLVDIQLLDHIIVADNKAISLANRGYLLDSIS